MNQNSRVLVAGIDTIAGEALLKFLKKSGYSDIQSLTGKSLQSQTEVDQLFAAFTPEYVFFMGASSLGIGGNQKFPAELFTQNTKAVLHLYESARKYPPKKILYLASSCIYPITAPQPMKPEHLGTGPLEPTCEAYAKAKIFGIDLAGAFQKQLGLETVVAIPADTFGPEEDFQSENSHVVGALIKKIHAAQMKKTSTVTLWGTGKPVRDLIYSEDLSDACLFLMQKGTSGTIYNVSAHHFTSVSDLARTIAHVLGYQVTFVHDLSKPDGALAKTLDATPLKQLGWTSKFDLAEAIAKTYAGYLGKDGLARA